MNLDAYISRLKVCVRDDYEFVTTIYGEYGRTCIEVCVRDDYELTYI